MAEQRPYAISYILSDDLEPYRGLFLRHCGRPEQHCRTTMLSISGQRDAPMYYLLSGMIKVFTTNPGGYMRILGYHRQNTLFAMDRIVTEEACLVSTQAVTNVTVLPVAWEDLNRMAGEEPRLMPDLLRYYGKVLRLMCYDAEVKSIDDVAVRLASFLCLTTGDTEENPCVELTQEEMASAVNASRVQIARVCLRFRQEGLIETRRGKTVLLDRNRLAGRLRERYEKEK